MVGFLGSPPARWSRRRFLQFLLIMSALLPSGSRPSAKSRAVPVAIDSKLPLTDRERDILTSLIAQIVPIDEHADSLVNQVHMDILATIERQIGESRQSRLLYHTGLASFEERSIRTYGAGFVQLSRAQQVELLSWLDRPTEHYDRIKTVVGYFRGLKEWLATMLPIRAIKFRLLEAERLLRDEPAPDFWQQLKEDVVDGLYSHPAGHALIGLNAIGMPTGPSNAPHHSGGTAH